MATILTRIKHEGWRNCTSFSTSKSVTLQ